MMNIKKILISLVFVFTLFTASVYAKTLELSINRSSINVKESHIVTGENIASAPYIENDRTMVPVRVISEKLGAIVGWDEAEYKVTITQNGKKIVLQIGSNTADVNGVETQLDTAPVIKNDTTMVPLRFVSENLGYDVKYVQPTRQVLVTNNPHVGTVGNVEISYDEFELMHDIYLSSYYGVYNESEIVELTMAYLKDMYALYDSALVFGVTLTPDDEREILNYLEQDKENLNPAWLSSVYVDMLSKIKIVENYESYIYRLVYQADVDLEKFYYSKYVQVKDVYISKTNPDAKKLAMDILRKASRGVDFDVLMEKYSQGNADEDMIKYGYIVTEGDVPDEYLTAARALKVGQLSSVVETDSGYYVIKKLELTPYSPDFDVVLYKTAAEMSFNNYMETLVKNAHYSENLTTEKILEKLAE